MNKRLQGVVLGVLLWFLIACGISFAASSKKSISVTYRDIKLVIDDKEITPRDAAGNVVEPFIHNGTTYLPVRAVGEALGKDIDWDNDTSTVHINETEPKKVYLYDLEPNVIFEKADFYKAEIDSVKYVGFRPFKAMVRYNFSASQYSVYYRYENQMTFIVPENATYFSGCIVSLDDEGEHEPEGFRISIYDDNGVPLFSNTEGEFEFNVSKMNTITFKCEGASEDISATPCAIKDASFSIKD